MHVDLNDPLDRLNNLYYIIDKSGRRVQFRMNWAQERFYQRFWHLNVILKARQLGLTTMSNLLLLDEILFNKHKSAGIIAHSKEDVEQIFRNKVKYAFDNIPEPYKQLWQVNTDNARELVFSNGSSIRVGRSMRSSTLQLLHISEFAKICREYPEKAREIITGALNTVQAGSKIIIESTAEGREGYFYDMCMEALNNKLQKKRLTPLDFRFHFFPWHEEPVYRIPNPGIVFPRNMVEYFEKLEANGIKLDNEQKAWYYKKFVVQGEDMWREYPSTPEEAFQASTEGMYYAKELTRLRAEGRLGNVPYDPAVPVNTAWDLGYGDSTSIFFWQEVNKELHIIDYYENSGEPLTHYIKYIQNKEYIYGTHFAPHDIQAHEYTSGVSRYETARKLGINFKIVPKLSVEDGIEAVRNVLGRCWFDEAKTSEKGLKCLEGYHKEWNARLGCWGSRPVHDANSHGADAFRYLALSVGKSSGKKVTAEEADQLWRNYGGI